MKSLMILLFVLTTACASQAPQRDGARLLAVHTNTLTRELETFSGRRTAIDKNRYADTAGLLRSALEAEDFNARTRASWGTEKSTLFADTQKVVSESVDRFRAADAVLNVQQQLIASTASKVAVRNAQLGEAAKALGSLSEREKPRDLLKFYRAFAEEVRDSIAAANEDHEKSEKAAADGAKEMAPNGGKQ